MKYCSLLVLILFIAFRVDGQISGTPNVCVGATTALTCATPPGGTWSSGNLAVASVDGVGVVTGVADGTVAITYAMAPTTYTMVVTVNPIPEAIAGPAAVCAGRTILMADATATGTWSSSNVAVATVGTAGDVTGLTAGAVNITYRLTTGCQTVKPITVNAAPAPISGVSQVCSGSFTTFSSGPSGGNWTTDGSAVSVHPITGVITAISAGVANITYTIGSTGCYATKLVTVHAMPGPIVGAPSVCIGAITTLGNATAGGTWLSTNATVASVAGGVSSSTVVAGISAGTTVVSYITAPICVTSVVVTVNTPTVAGVVSGTTVFCAGDSNTFVSTVTGGTWSSSAPSVIAIGSSSGVATGLSSGLATLSYSVPGICGPAYATINVTVNAAPSVIAGSTVLCEGVPGLLTNTAGGGTWVSGMPGVVGIGSLTGVVSGMSVGTSEITYTLTGGCFTSSVITVNPSPAPVTGPGSVCTGSTVVLADAVAGGTWGSSSPGTAIVATIGSSTGVVTGMSAGTATITYSLGSCFSTLVITVDPQPVIALTTVPDLCGGSTSMLASGGATYVWSPAAGLACSTCAATSVVPVATTVYTVTGTDILGCSNTATVLINGDRISGHISFSAVMPSTPDMKVWLIMYDNTDSSIITVDSVLTCMDGAQGYYQFDFRPAGNYFVKSKLLSSVPGTSDYVPTYGGSTPNWFDATSVSHAGAADVLDISMIYGTVPAGPGFISGYIYSGAGKGTSSEIPAEGILVFLKDVVTGRVLTHTYTNSVGGYSFGSLGFGDYIVYPEEYGYYTTPASMITLSPTSVSAVNVTFKRHTILHTIFPYNYTAVNDIAGAGNAVSIYPNPAGADVHISGLGVAAAGKVLITDITGRVVLQTAINAGSDGKCKLDVSSMVNGAYFISVLSGERQSIHKLVIAK